MTAVRFWVAKPNVPEQTVGDAYRLSPYPDDPNPDDPRWQLEIDQGNGWRLFLVREKAVFEDYLRYREERGWFREVDDLQSAEAKRWRGEG